MDVQLFQALADPTRLQIIEALRDGEHAVNDVVEKVNIDQSGVSRHLRILQQAGFVQMRPDGARHLYSLRAQPFEDLELWVARYRALWEARLDRFSRALAQKQKARVKRRKEP